jgi:hypothetical protein
MDVSRTEPLRIGVHATLPLALLGLAALVGAGLLISGCEDLLAPRGEDMYRERSFLPAGLPGLALHVQLAQHNGRMDARIGVENRGTAPVELGYGVCSIEFVVAPPGDPSGTRARLRPEPPLNCPDVGLVVRVPPGGLVWPDRLDGAADTRTAPSGEHALTLLLYLWREDDPPPLAPQQLAMGRVRLP